MNKETPSLQPGSDFSQNSMFTRTHPSKADGTATAWKPHSTFSTTLSKLNSVYPELSAGTQLGD